MPKGNEKTIERVCVTLRSSNRLNKLHRLGHEAKNNLVLPHPILFKLKFPQLSLVCSERSCAPVLVC